MQYRLINLDMRQHITPIAQEKPIPIIRLYHLVYKLELMVLGTELALDIQLAMWFPEA